MAARGEKADTVTTLGGLGRVAALVPAHNEAPRIGAVLEALLAAESLDEVVVIDDGSSDGTGAAALKGGARVIAMEKNGGKGAALQRGLDEVGADTYVFIDADLTGLLPAHIDALLAPLRVEPQVQMVTGMAVSGRLRVDLAQRFFPVLNGQRALRRSFVDSLPDLTHARWGTEVLLDAWARRQEARLPGGGGSRRGAQTAPRGGATIRTVRLVGLSQIMKEEKDGVFRGMASRLRMYYQVLKMTWRLRRGGRDL